MKTLYIIRHAKSSWGFDLPDDKRPLNERGERDAELIGKELKTLVKPVDRILCSPAERAYNTAKIISYQLNISEDIFVLEPDLYDFEGSKVINVIKNCTDTIQTLMIFGHNHAFTSVANLLGNTYIDNLPTSGVVAIEFETEKWKDINVGKTLLTIFPKSLK
ncbi:SixA phosphatase family protein [Aquimarina muelleri]|uniref:Phosphohistidine phosphatase SixA n=1 Tax=Aquimarina muelleri TaxID=279356 RepID=A0A918JRI2_9FLAO|nr:histidine phosphatase family protein [Aquimarina muelleri]MCX2762360.1 histidine phosphatase family protein [Aquimarina muelleri]GGX03718.1 phosphohistidine phosphatase SixA [Aquimarina muelleri]